MAGSSDGIINYAELVSQALQFHLNLTEGEVNRIGRYRKHWDFYLGKQWQVQQVAGEAQLQFNYSQMVVDCAHYYLFKEAPQISRDTEDGEDEGETKKILQYLKDVWRFQLAEPRLRTDISLMASVTGDAFVSVSSIIKDEDGNDLPPDQQRIIVTLLESELCFPKFREFPYGELEQISIFRPWVYVPEPVEGGPQNPVAEAHVFKEIISDDLIREFVDSQELTKPQKLYGVWFAGTRPNPLGKVNVVHIPNRFIPRDFYGQSDLSNQTNLNKELNVQASEIADILSYHSSPVTIVQGAKATNLERGKDKVWGGIPADGKVYNLEMQSDLAGSQKFFAEVRSAMLETSRIPEVATGRALAVANLSGSALNLLYSPMMELVSRKQPGYVVGYQRINELILRIGELQQQVTISRKGFGKYYVDIAFKIGLPRNQLEEVQTAQLLLQLKLTSRERLWKDWGVEDPEELARQIDQELKDGIIPQMTLNVGGNLRPPPSGNDTAGPNKPVAGPGRPANMGGSQT